MGVDGLDGLADTAAEKQDEAAAMTSVRALQAVMDRLVERGELDRAEEVCRRAITSGQQGAHILMGDLFRLSRRSTKCS